MIEATDLDNTREKKWGVSPEESLGGNFGEQRRTHKGDTAA